MKQPVNFMSCGLVAALALLNPCAAWSAASAAQAPAQAVAKKAPKAAHKVKKLRAKAGASKAPVAAAPALATPVQPEPAVAPASNVVPAIAPAFASTLAPIAVANAASASPPKPYGNPYLVNVPQAALPNPVQSLNQVFNNLKLALPILPNNGQSILPVIKTVYPTGEKPLVVITFKCPTELIGVTPLPTKALHELVNTGMDALNNSNLLSFNMQQVCS